jgi:3-deoxy-D-arabino-heptulosonate 7-phosphate (DAHP) synthase class II
MNAQSAPRWSTASFGEPEQTLPMELHELGAHLGQCAHNRGLLFSARCAAESFHGFVASRLVTSLVVVVAMLAGASALML